MDDLALHDDSAATEAAGVVAAQRTPVHDTHCVGADALVEQAKGVLIFRYAVDAVTALAVLEHWAVEADSDPVSVAIALVHDICGGQPGSRTDPALVTWLQERLRQDRPQVALEVTADLQPVGVVLDDSNSSLDDVVVAAREAARAGLPLEISLSEQEPGLPRAHLLQRADLAVELARAVEPGLEVRLATGPSVRAEPDPSTSG